MDNIGNFFIIFARMKQKLLSNFLKQKYSYVISSPN